MAATLPLPAAARGFSAAIAVKLLVNALAETLGVADDDDVDVLAGVDDAAAELEDELEDELPHAATVRLAVTASAAKTALLLSKRTLTSLSLCDYRAGTQHPRTANR